MDNFAIITYTILSLTTVTSLIAFPENVKSIEEIRKPEWYTKFMFNSPLILKEKQYVRILSHGFIHANWTHLIFNMLTLFFFGPFIEKSFKILFGPMGGILYIVFYISAIVASAIPDLIKHRDDYYYNAVGASGAVSAVIFAAILFKPDMKIMFIFLPIPVTAWVFGVLYLAYSYYMAKRNVDNIGHNAHLWGALYGFIFPILFKPQLFTMFFDKILR